MRLAFSGASAARTLRRGWPGTGSLTIGLYVVMYLAIVFLLNLPLAFYLGFVRLHAYGLSNQTFAKWLGDALIRLAVAMAVGVAFTWVPYLLPGPCPGGGWLCTAVLSGPVPVRDALVQADLDRSALPHTFGPMKNKTLGDRSWPWPSGRGSREAEVFEVEKASTPRPSTLT